MTAADRVLGRVDGLREEMIATLGAAIAVRSVNPTYPDQDFDDLVGGETDVARVYAATADEGCIHTVLSGGWGVGCGRGVCGAGVAGASLPATAEHRSSSPESRSPSPSASRQNVVVVLFLNPLPIMVIVLPRAPPSLLIVM